MAAAASLLIMPASVAGHADLDVPTPADGATIESTPDEIFGTFTQAINPEGSSLVLRDAVDAVIARGGVDPEDSHRMVIADVPDLAPGDYLVQWTTISSEDGELDRDTWSFKVTAEPTPAPTPTSVAPSAPSAPSAALTASPSPDPEPSATASAAPSVTLAPPQDSAASGADVVLPIIAGLAIVLVAAGLLLSRRRPSGPA